MEQYIAQVDLIGHALVSTFLVSLMGLILVGFVVACVALLYYVIKGGK